MPLWPLLEGFSSPPWKPFITIPLAVALFAQHRVETQCQCERLERHTNIDSQITSSPKFSMCRNVYSRDALLLSSRDVGCLLLVGGLARVRVVVVDHTQQLAELLVLGR